jgi:hypothetical protein
MREVGKNAKQWFRIFVDGPPARVSEVVLYFGRKHHCVYSTDAAETFFSFKVHISDTALVRHLEKLDPSLVIAYLAEEPGTY